jgi:hypothetical protein
VDVGSVLQTYTGASCARAMTRIGVTGFGIGALDVGSPYIRSAMEAVNIIRCLPEGVVHRAVIDSVSYNGIRECRRS